MRKLLTILALSVTGFNAFSQQDPQFSQNMFNRLYANPGVAGSSDAICGTIIYRDQWDKFGSAPTTGVLNLDAPISVLHGGLGLSAITDKLGFESNLGVKLSYAFRFNVGATGKFAIGVSAGLLQKTIDGKFVPPDQTTPDPSIPQGSVSGSTFDLGAGLYYNSEKFYIGASVAHLTEGKIDLGNFDYNSARHYYGMIGYTLELSPNFALKPSAFVKTDSKETQADFNLNLHMFNRFWIGGSYRLEDAIVAMAGFNITPDLRIGYSYDITTSDVKDYSDGTHEIMLGYCYKIKAKVKPMIRNVRFL